MIFTFLSRVILSFDLKVAPPVIPYMGNLVECFNIVQCSVLELTVSMGQTDRTDGRRGCNA